MTKRSKFWTASGSTLGHKKDVQICSPCSETSVARLICALMISMSKEVRFICQPDIGSGLGHFNLSGAKPYEGSMPSDPSSVK